MRELNEDFERAVELAENGRGLEGLKLKDDALDGLNSALAEELDMEYLLPLMDQEPVQP